MSLAVSHSVSYMVSLANTNSLGRLKYGMQSLCIYFVGEVMY